MLALTASVNSVNNGLTFVSSFCSKFSNTDAVTVVHLISHATICHCMWHITDVDEAWYPKEKVNFARRKLDGDNCAHIMR